MLSEGTIKRTGENSYQVSYGDDSGVFAEFFVDAVLDEAASATNGRPTYVQKEMIRMIFAGNSKTVRVRPVMLEPSGNMPADPDRFPRQWAAFKAGQLQVQSGTPIEQWPPISKAMALNLKSMNIHTVEALASVTDANLNWMGARQLRDNAIAWLQEAEDGAEVMRLRARIADLELQLEAMRNQNAGFITSAQAKKVLDSESAAPSAEATDPNIKPIVRKMRGRPAKVKDGENVPPIDAASSE